MRTTYPVTQTARVPSAHSDGIGTRPVVGRNCGHWIDIIELLPMVLYIIGYAGIITLSDIIGRVVKCHGYGGYIRVKKLEGWGKNSGRIHSIAKSSIVLGKFEQLI